MTFLLSLSVMASQRELAQVRFHEDHLGHVLGVLFKAKGEVEVLRQQRKAAKGPVPELDKKILDAQLRLMLAQLEKLDIEETIRRYKQPHAARPAK